MALTYFFFRPARLPLSSADLSATTVCALENEPGLRAQVEQAFPGRVAAGDDVAEAQSIANAGAA